MTSLFSRFSPRLWFAAFGLAAALAVPGCAYVDNKQRELIFRPSASEWQRYGATIDETERQDVEIALREGESVHGWWVPNANARAPVMLYLHGARWNVAGNAFRIQKLRDAGFSVLAIDYRGFGKSKTAEHLPSEAMAYEDAKAAWARLVSHYGRGKPAFIYGHSLGGAVAVELARHAPEAKGVVLEATFTSIKDIVGSYGYGWVPLGLVQTQKFDSLGKIGKLKVPVLMFHGVRDGVIPVALGKKLFEAAPEPKQLVLVEEGNHANISWYHAETHRAALAMFVQSEQWRMSIAKKPLPR
jgi:uncharacterized protein